MENWVTEEEEEVNTKKKRKRKRRRASAPKTILQKSPQLNHLDDILDAHEVRLEGVVDAEIQVKGVRPGVIDPESIPGYEASTRPSDLDETVGYEQLDLLDGNDNVNVESGPEQGVKDNFQNGSPNIIIHQAEVHRADDVGASLGNISDISNGESVSILDVTAGSPVQASTSSLMRKPTLKPVPPIPLSRPRRTRKTNQNPDFEYDMNLFLPKVKSPLGRKMSKIVKLPIIAEELG